jgi:hypothetical protein
MSLELHYTSVPRGLKPGSRGFGTVAATAQLADTLADRLESLSGYQAVYPPGDPASALNPIVHAHFRLTAGGKVLDVLSRIGPAGLDYSGRPNKYAHHIVLDDDERPEGGPAWLLSQPGFLQTAWEGEPRLLPAGRPVPQGDRPAGVASAWQALTGDAGWAGVMAESFLADPRRAAFLVFRPGLEILPLFVEAIALLPAPRRWEVEFSTYFNTLPQGVSCSWRGVLDGSAEAKNARRLPNALIVDLCRPIGRASGDVLVHLARTGEHRERPGGGPHPQSHPETRRAAYPMAGPPQSSTRRLRPGPQAEFDVLPDLAARLASELLLSDGEPARRQRRSRGFLVATIVAACLVPLFIAGLFWTRSIRTPLELEPRVRRPISEPDARGSPIPKDAPARGAALAEARKAEDAAVAKESASKPGSQSLPAVEAVSKAVDKPGKKVADTKPPVAEPSQPVADAPRSREPLILACALPEIPKSEFAAKVPQHRELDLPEDVDDRFDLLNAPEFRQTPAAAASTRDIAARTGSGLGGGYTLARLGRINARSWRFEWTKDARNHSTQVDAFRDAVLKFRARDGRAIFVLLRGVETRDGRPITVVEKQPLLFDRLEPRIRTVAWTRNPEVLAATTWKLRIRRWKVVIARPDDELLRREFESAPIPGGQKDDSPRVKLEQDLIPGEVKLKLKIDPESPDVITVRVEPDRARVAEGRNGRTARREALAKDTPSDKEGRERDPIEYRRGKLTKLEAADPKDDKAIVTLKREIDELEQIDEIRQIEDLLSKPARAELSVVIGLDVGDSTSLDIAKVGKFAD